MNASTLPDYNAWRDEDFRREVRTFVESRYPRELRYVLRRVRWAEIRDWWRTLYEHGWIAPNWPRERGGIAVERVWHSPLIRAVETAEIFCDQLDITATRREIDGLLPDDDIRGIARRLSGFGYPLLVVGHEPHLGRLASMLVCGNVDQDIVEFKKGALLCLEREATKSQTILWRIRWFITPALLDRADQDAAE